MLPLDKLISKNLRCSLTNKGNIKAKKLLRTKRKYKWFNCNSYPLSEIVDLNLVNEITYLKSGNGRSHTKSRLIENLTPDLCYLFGCMRDGSLINSKGMHWIRIYDALNSKWIESAIIGKFKKIFDVDFKIRMTQREKYCGLSNKPLFYQFKFLLNDIHRDVPEIIKKTNLVNIKNYIRGFFDAEGYVSKNKNVLMITQKNKDALNSLKFLLEKIIGINCGKINAHRLPIYGKNNVIKFYKEIGSFNPLKVQSLEKLSRG